VAAGSATEGAGSGSAKECGSTAGSTTTGFSIIGSAVGSTEKAGDFAEREDRRRDFFGEATSVARATSAT